MSGYDPSPEGALRELRMWATTKYRMSTADFEKALAAHNKGVRAAYRAALIESGELPPDCNGLCRTAADIGIDAPGWLVARPDPSCPLHGYHVKEGKSNE